MEQSIPLHTRQANRQHQSQRWDDVEWTSSAFARLPMKLLEDVLSRLRYFELAALTQTSKALHSSIEPILFRRTVARDRAMHWACRTGHVTFIRHLVGQYGASPSVIGDQRENGGPLRQDDTYDESDNRPWMQLTLGVAVRAGQLTAMELLVELGAQVKPDAPPIEGGEENHLGSRMLHQQRRKLIRRVVDADSDTAERAAKKLALCRFMFCKLEHQLSIAGMDPASLLQSLPGLIQSNHDIELVKFLLGYMAEHNVSTKVVVERFEKTGAHEYLSSLSAAVLRDAPDIFRLLVDHGAGVDGPTLPIARYGPTTLGLHIPIFAAARRLAENLEAGKTAVRMCLERGADINQTALCMGSRSVNHKLTVHYQYTPLSVYLDSLPRRVLLGGKNEKVAALGGDALEGLSFLLENGALVASENILNRNRESWTRGRRPPSKFYHWRYDGQWPASPDILLIKFGPVYATRPWMRSILEKLMLNVRSLRYLDHLVKRYGPWGKDALDDWLEKRVKAAAAERVLMRMVVSSLTVAERSYFFADLADRSSFWPPHHRPLASFPMLDLLLAYGADVNGECGIPPTRDRDLESRNGGDSSGKHRHRGDEPGEDKSNGNNGNNDSNSASVKRPTALHLICLNVNIGVRLHNRTLLPMPSAPVAVELLEAELAAWERDRPQRTAKTKAVLETTTYLLTRGASLTLRYKGKTPIEMLLEDVNEEWSEHRRKYLRDMATHIEMAAAVLQV